MFRNPYSDALVALLIVLLIFGPKRLPSLGRQLGSGIREFKDGITGKSGDDADEERPQIQQASASAPASTGADEQDPARVAASSERRS